MGGKHTSTSDPKINSISIQSSTLGLPLAIGAGRNRRKPNLIWYNAFTATPHTTQQSAGKGLGGGSSSTSYTYTASIILAIGEGPVSGIRTVYRDKSVFTSLAAAGLSLATGAPDQPVWSYLTSVYPAQARAYARIAYVYAADYALTDSAALPNHSFEVDHPIQMAGLADADPKDWLVEFFTNAQWGLPGWGTSLLGDWSEWSSYCRANNLLISPLLEAQVQASAHLTEITDLTNSAPFWSEGLLKIRPYGDRPATGNGVTFTPNLTPEYDLTEADFIAAEGTPAVKIVILDQSDAYNISQVECLDRDHRYDTAIMTSPDDADIALNGPRKADPVTWHSICDVNIAQHACDLLNQRVLYKRLQYTFTLPWSFVLLEPMDLVTLTTETDELQLTRQLVRILQIDESESDDTLAFTAEHVDIGIATAARFTSGSSDGFSSNTDVAPGSVSPPALINAPTSLTAGDPEIWCAVASTSPTWGGCEVWISVDGDKYSRIGRINGPARYGVLTAALVSHGDPDTTNTLSVSLATSRGSLGSATAAEANAGGSLCMIDGELLTYQTATLTGANAYTLTSLRRGFQGTSPAAHASGASFVRLDDAIFKFSYAKLNVGSTIYVKLPSFNVYGRAIEDLATVSAYSVSLAPVSALPDPVTGLALSLPWTGSTLSVVCDASARATSYKFRFYKADETTLVREIVTTTPAATYSAALAAQDGVQRAYAIEVLAGNDAGYTAPSTWLTVTNSAPPAVSSPAIAGGATVATATCTATTDPDVAGYVLFYSSASGFDPATTGGLVASGIPSVSVFGLAAGTYYGRIAAFDGWSSNPATLNLSSEISFTITTGGGSTPSGGGTTGGGYDGRCVVDTTPILIANATLDGPGKEKAARDCAVGDWVWTRHEITMEWGAYPITAISFSNDPTFAAPGYPNATRRHRFWVDRWVTMEVLGVPVGSARVAKITVDDAHTYVSAGVLSHNIKQFNASE
ncbi:hypothetical protein GCM10008023_06040 [Sphingomonas glacialis]|uniref:Fibronectin type-III domain-containing protein n=1 Tax=Sphingomonas glacialis TaxID=658225 RepID=A0ABQ3LBJ5_9SPHN|nr:phage tail protein [Sphingomonas glacialis]GHH09402.1 hypothetical protein GCM10008023_06040 [Sphingomonas glacialis]